ncbi:hypothetical protein, partial [Frankia sp. CpI1-P]|uniref:hypothetical protein n=1 Tax=Frankia sp. CpI1-P TaxID=1502734 RepID=UPI0037BEB776
MANPLRPTRRATLTSHTGAVYAAVFTRDGRTALTGSADRTAILWNVGGLADLLAHLPDRACVAAGGGLTPSEWRSSIPDIS